MRPIVIDISINDNGLFIISYGKGNQWSLIKLKSFKMILYDERPSSSLA